MVGRLPNEGGHHGVLQVKRRAIEIVEIERRLGELENQLGRR